MATSDHPPDDVPSTPPNTTDLSHHQPELARRKSTRLCTPMSRPGFIATQTNSRRAIVPIATKRTQPPQSEVPAATDWRIEPSQDSPDPNAFSGPTQVSKRTGQAVVVDITQDSDDDNQQARGTGNGDKKKDRDGFDCALLYCSVLADATSKAHACRWCPNQFKVQARSTYNLKCHRDGTFIKGSLRLACPGRHKAIAAGADLPPSASEVVADKAAAQPAAVNNLIAYTSKGQFSNNTLNRLVVIWVLHSRVWAASVAHKLYLEQPIQVVKSIKEFDSMVLLISDVWTTKGSHKAFMGISCCYITKDWKYVSQHLAIKYISWHHNGKYLATPLANVLVKHKLHEKMTLTTDSGSNSFTMAAGVASTFRAYNSTEWNVSKNHHRCACHVIALILGAGLRALQLSKVMLRPEKADKFFPTLGSIDEEEELAAEDIVEVVNPVSDEEQDIDPDDAEEAVLEPGWEQNGDEDNYVESNQPGIGFTLKKVDYICRRIASSPQKQAEFKIWARSRNYTGRGVIGGYGYEVTMKEWEDVNTLNLILKEFLDLTKQMEGDGPKLGVMLYAYLKLRDSLEKKEAAAASAPLEPMFGPMLKTLKKYIDLAINCDTVVITTFLHPAWRLMLFKKDFPSKSIRIESLVGRVFQQREALIKSAEIVTPPTKASQSENNLTKSDSESEADDYNFYPPDLKAISVNTELERYNSGVFPMDRKGDVLGWWKAHTRDFPVLGSLARDYLACAASSATVERTFSAAAGVCGTARTSLAIRTIERCISSHMWLRNNTPTNNIPKCKTTQPQPQHTQDLKAILTKPDKQLEEIQELINQNFEANNDQIGLLRELLRLEKGKREKAETINAIYEFVLSVEQIVCRRLNIEHSTLTRALRSDGTTWIDVRTLLNLEDDSSDGLLALIKHIKTSRLGHGRASPTTAKNLVLSKSLVPLAEENCSLTPKQVALLRKLLDWVVHDLSESATLADLRLAVEELMVLDSCLDSDLDSPLSESSLF
ncbi:hypothetical protein MJO28_009956 [Puccinia striiformis f. sp. tritici]|uniref:Uncharacterized protein n=1 Tax=Puccinia striiformis f. sp. tritici TaxID=168172 RepID=A0ACC0E982_9BASI|nr:hypothetical protein MJO28_009956 [Puccinia striiformis f. sp. tritici]